LNGGGLMRSPVCVIAVMSIAVTHNETIVKASINSISRNLAQLRHVKELDDAELRNTLAGETVAKKRAYCIPYRGPQ